jgi:hypothetical protein
MAIRHSLSLSGGGGGGGGALIGSAIKSKIALLLIVNVISQSNLGR